MYHRGVASGNNFHVLSVGVAGLVICIFNIQLLFSPQRSNLIRPKSKVAGADLQGSKLTFVLIVAVTAAVIGSSAQFGYNTGVINNPENVRR